MISEGDVQAPTVHSEELASGADYSAGFTLNTYTHTTAQMKRDAADMIGAVISKEM